MIRIARLLAVIAALLSANVLRADYAHEVAQDHPVAWWRFPEKAMADGALAKDETGRHAGVYHGNVTVADGIAASAGGAVRFDGRSAFVEVPNDTSFALSTLSVECWFRSTQDWSQPNWPASATLISKATEGAGSGDWVLLGGAADGRSGIAMSRPGPLGGSRLSPGLARTGQRWHLASLGLDLRGQRRQLFVPGWHTGGPWAG